jgi:hypothetical protein
VKERKDVALILEKPVTYSVRRSDRARRLSLQVSPRKGLEVVLPRRWNLQDVQRALTEHADWIDRQVDRYGVRHGPASRELTTGSVVFVLGAPRVLRLDASDAGRLRPRVSAERESLHVQLTPADALDPRPVLRRWLRRLARRHLEDRVAELALRHGFTPGRIIVGERETRWGSCSSRGNLSFCYRLVMAPPEVIDAVVLHELCHLRHLNHGPEFRALLDRLCPGHDAQMAWLKDHHDQLQI